MKKPTIKALKNKLDKLFSDYIRQRGADENGTNNCVTCGALKHWKELQCGHWHSRRHLATRFDPMNSQVQCGRCNVLLRGNYTAYARFMYANYSAQQLDELEALSRTTIKMTRSDYEALIEKYSHV